MIKNVILMALSFTCSMAVSAPAEKHEVKALKPLFEGTSGRVELGGLSDLVYSAKDSTSNTKIFYSITDRGPNGKSRGSKETPERSFLQPQFVPQILKIELSKDGAKVTQTFPLSKSDKKSASGLPNVDPRKSKTFFDEVPYDNAGKELALDAWGIDPEALAFDSQGNFWIAEEYGPSILKVAKNGEILKRFVPKGSTPLRGGEPALPEFLTQRRLNRGFEAATVTANNRIWFFLQSGVESISKDFAPVIEVDPVTDTVTGLFLYPLSKEGGKIGAATLATDGKIWVLEQSGKTGKKAWQRIFALDSAKAENLLKSAHAATFTLPKNPKAFAKTEVLNLTEAGLGDFEKLEGLAVHGTQVFVVNDNDFGVHDNKSTPSYLFVMGAKDEKK